MAVQSDGRIQLYAVLLTICNSFGRRRGEEKQ
jgi:hypothetical protein